ncbi:MAG TPA: hypothetical protein VJ725_18100 [Thermoanaerobaculia bacterium]|nr:hypothetical protein [Thermoanaerobaculia bacterium]
MDEIEAEGPLYILQESVPHEAPEIARFSCVEARQALQERKFVSVGLPKMDDAKASVTVELHGVGRALEELPEEVGETSIPAEPREVVVILVRRDQAVDKTAFEEAGEELPDKTFWFCQRDHAQSSA